MRVLVLIAVMICTLVFWAVTACGVGGRYQCFGGSQNVRNHLQDIWCHNPKDHILNSQCHVNIKSKNQH
jgi:hypothetical protein